MLKKIVKIVLILIAIIAIGAGYLYFRLHNTIDNVLVAKDSWRSEVLEFPLIFAGDLDFKGEEHIRFAPGWGQTNSEDYFSYVFLWLLEEDPALNPAALEKLMNIYFDGLMNTGAITNFSFFKNIPETKSSLQQTSANTYEGEIELFDEFFAKKIIVLNAIIKSKYCLETGKHLVWFYLSPQENSHEIWEKLMAIPLKIKCN